MKQKCAFVVAHYHARGLVRSDTIALLYTLRQFGDVTVVSTNLAEDQVRSIPPGIKVIVRENIGYDFYSYKIGLQSFEDLSQYDYVYILNDSFVCLDPIKLIARFNEKLDGSVDVLGLTESRELASHLQSYFMAFSKKVITAPAVRAWWDALEPISDRMTVIMRYELGLSKCLLDHGFKLSGAYQPSSLARQVALVRGIQHRLHHSNTSPHPSVTVKLKLADQLNMTHFAWKELLDQFGIVKRELVVKNPYRMDLRGLLRDHGPALMAL